ncbi:MAG TPA: hypothetical protein VFQ10_14325, partial [Rubrobacter sp.]|nr:hypothetical protein [Rubrobacter sp.]
KRWLLRYFVRRQVTRSYKRSYLGLAWAILGPLIWVFFLTIIFSEVVGAYRGMILESTLPGGLATLYFSVFSIALFFVGFALFVRFKAGFADHI